MGERPVPERHIGSPEVIPARKFAHIIPPSLKYRDFQSRPSRKRTFARTCLSNRPFSRCVKLGLTFDSQRPFHGELSVDEFTQVHANENKKGAERRAAIERQTCRNAKDVFASRCMLSGTSEKDFVEFRSVISRKWRVSSRRNCE